MKSKSLKKMLSAFLAATLCMTAAIPAYAEFESSTESNNVEITNDLNNYDIIDASKKGSLTIYKYDITAATQDNVYTQGINEATGKADSTLQTALADYAIAGVEFTYLKVGNIEQYSYTTGTGTQVNLVYEIPAYLAGILGLADEDGNVLAISGGSVVDSGSDDSDLAATDMDASGVSEPCSKSDVYHYTSDQINTTLEALLDNDDVAAKNALEEYIEDNGGTAMDLTDQYGYTTTGSDALELGLYLVVETAVPENITDTVNPFFVSIPMTDITTTSGGESWFYDITVYPKNQSGNPTLDKMVRNATGTAATTAGSYEDTSLIVTNLTDIYATYGALTDLNGDTNIDALDFILQRGGYEYSTTNNGVDAGSNDGSTTNQAVTTQESVAGEYQYASTTTASAGDTLDYIIVSKLPHITSEATYLTTYTYVDVLSEALTYNKDVSIAFYTNKEDAYINNTANAVDIWSLVYDKDGYATDTNNYAEAVNKTLDSKKTQLTVSFTTAGLAQINGDNTNSGTYGYSDYYMVVYYTATVNSTNSITMGDSGNANDVTLTWERTSSGYTAELQDRSYVYTFGLDLTKYFSDNAGDFSEVSFNLYNKTDGYYVTATKSADGVYYVDGKAASQSDATVFVPASDGTLKIYGLEGDTYGLTELTTDTGYSLLGDEIVIAITTSYSSIQATVAGWTGLSGYNYGQQNGLIAMIVGDVNPASAKVDEVDATMLSYGGSENALVSMVITNTRTFTLPLTGGAGLYLITILGIVVFAGGCYAVFGRRKKNEKMDEAA